MSRVNVGVNPEILTDQWLIAESVEITMITGNLRKNNYQIKSKVPDKFKLGAGHINFFKNKLSYLKARLEAVNKTMRKRGFKPGTSIDLDEFPDELCNYWMPSAEDTKILRERLIEKIEKKRIKFWRYHGIYIENYDKYLFLLKHDPLFKL